MAKGHFNQVLIHTRFNAMNGSACGTVKIEAAPVSKVC